MLKMGVFTLLIGTIGLVYSPDAAACFVHVPKVVKLPKEKMKSKKKKPPKEVKSPQKPQKKTKTKPAEKTTSSKPKK